jgi:hypothetical protein
MSRYAADNAIGSRIEGSSLLTHVAIGHIRVGAARNRRSRSLGSGSPLRRRGGGVGYSAGVAANAASVTASCGAVRSSALAGIRLKPRKNTATIR